MGKKLFLAAAAVVLLLLPCAYLLQAERQTPDAEPLRTLTAYIKAAYAHDLRKAYRFIAAEDPGSKAKRSTCAKKARSAVSLWTSRANSPS